MNQEWQDFLTVQGAQLHEGFVAHFGDLQAELLATRDGTVLCDLSQFGILKVAGEDAQNFLQNLFSNDIKSVNAGTAQLSSFNSAKGRMLATFLIWQSGGDYYLQLPRSLLAAMLKKLTMYVLRSKVKISDVSDDIVCLGLAGQESAQLIQQNVGVPPASDMSVNLHSDVSVIRLAEHRFQLCIPPQQAATLWTKLKTAASPAGSVCWDWLNIRAGIPVITPATQEQFVLQMANLDVLGGVSFKKGCYPGQEIVARTHYLGKQKRRMFPAHVESDSAPVAGDELFSDEMAGQACGMVVNASPAAGGGFDLLGVMQIGSREADNVHLRSPEGAKLRFLPLPYALPQAE